MKNEGAVGCGGGTESGYNGMRQPKQNKTKHDDTRDGSSFGLRSDGVIPTRKRGVGGGWLRNYQHVLSVINGLKQLGGAMQKNLVSSSQDKAMKVNFNNSKMCAADSATDGGAGGQGSVRCLKGRGGGG